MPEDVGGASATPVSEVMKFQDTFKLMDCGLFDIVGGQHPCSVLQWDTLHLKKIQINQRCACLVGSQISSGKESGIDWSKKQNHKLTLAKKSRFQPASSSPTWLLSLDAKTLGNSFGILGESSPSWMVKDTGSI